MFFWNKICVIAAFFFISLQTVNAQNEGLLSKGKYFFLAKPVQSSNALFFSAGTKRGTKNFLPKNQVLPLTTGLLDFYSSTPGFFCRQEIKIQKATGLPIFLRLGSLNQCNYYEGKN